MSIKEKYKKVKYYNWTKINVLHNCITLGSGKNWNTLYSKKERRSVSWSCI